MDLHHVGVQTDDLTGTVQWYSDFFDGSRLNWRLDEFSDLTTSRLPGISQLIELQIGSVRFHIYDRAELDPDHTMLVPCFQHCGLTVESPDELTMYRERWYELAGSGRHNCARAAEPSDVVFDGDGVGSLYVEDINGLELELTYVPGHSGR